MLNIGEYVFSTFIATINTKMDLKSSATWTVEQRAVIAHEFLHCYQNCASVYGQMCIKHSADVAASIATDKNDEVKLPFSPQEYMVISQEWHKIRDAPKQNWEEVNMIIDCSLEDVKHLEDAIKNSSLETLKKHEIKQAVVKVATNRNMLREFFLDGNALCESMAAMIESKIFPKHTHYRATYPYCIAKDVARLKKSNIQWDNDILILLCDLCLDTFDPGITFLLFLDSIDNKNTSISVYDVFTFFTDRQVMLYNQTNDQMKSLSWSDYRKQVRNNTLSSLENMITNSQYTTAYKWIRDGIIALSIIRDNLLSNVEKYKQCFPYDWNWLVGILSVGYPIFRLEPETIARPEFFVLGNNQGTGNKQWQYWDGIMRFLNILSIDDWSNLFCPFYMYCNSIDKEICSDDPFRLYKRENCKFQHYMSIFNLEKKRIIAPDGSIIHPLYNE